MLEACQLISDQAGRLFSCEQVGENVRISTPFFYPDGDVVDIFLAEQKDGFILTDFGESVRWLKMQTASKRRRTSNQERIIQDVCQNCGVSFFRGCIQTATDQSDNFADEVIRLSQACLKVADLWFTFRARGTATITDEVAEFLDDQGVSFEKGQPIAGRSTRSWSVDFDVWTRNRSLVQVLSTSSRGASRRITEHVVAQWYDLQHMTSSSDPVRLISLFDDTLDVWGEEDFNLLADLSQVEFWSRPDNFLKAVAA